MMRYLKANWLESKYIEAFGVALDHCITEYDVCFLKYTLLYRFKSYKTEFEISL